MGKAVNASLAVSGIRSVGQARVMITIPLPLPLPSRPLSQAVQPCGSSVVATDSQEPRVARKAVNASLAVSGIRSVGQCVGICAGCFVQSDSLVSFLVRVTNNKTH